MQFRGVITAALVAIPAVSAALMPPELVTPQASRIGATFLGLFAAGIMPAISLLVQSVNSTGKSVYRVDELEAEISNAVEKLFHILGAAGFATFVMLCLSVKTPEPLQFLQYENALERVGHGVVGGLIGFVIANSGTIPSIIRKALRIRFDQTRHEAKQALNDAAPSRADIKSGFPKKENFGKRRQLAD